MTPELRRGLILLVWTLFGLFGLLVLRHAWICDDAYITLRTVDHFVNGRGLVWNPGERVQAYTHPLWMFLIAAVYAITREPYFTLLALSVALSFATAWLLAFRHARDVAGACLALAALSSSHAFTDYSTSGLENPLTHFLLALFLLGFLDERPADVRRIFLLSLCACAGVLNRLDTILLFAPPLLLCALEARTSARSLGALALGFTPLVGWEIFSILYYGFPLPNTYYAKLRTGIPAAELAEQGLLYLVSSLDLDPITPLTMAGGLVLSFARRRPREWAMAAGVVLYVAYVVRIGGDFMLGRFWTAPLLVAAVLLARFRGWPAGALAPAPGLALLLVGIVSQYSTLESDADYRRDRGRGVMDARRVVDERATYYDFTGLLRRHRGEWIPEHRWARRGAAWPEPAAEQRPVMEAREVGWTGYFGGDRVHVLDPYALGDPLLARLPPLWYPNWVAGHMLRHVPAGYRETLASGRNALVDPGLAAYWDRLALVTRGPIFSRERLVTIWRMNRGAYDHLIDDERYRFAEAIRVRLGELADLPPGAPLDAPGVRKLAQRGGALVVDLEGVRRAPRIVVAVGSDFRYRVTFRLRGRELGAVETSLRPRAGGAIAHHRLEVPEAAVREGYDELRIVAVTGDSGQAVAGVKLEE